MTVTGPDPTIHRQVIAAARQVLETEPGAPISRIAREAGVSRATFYRHFRSRDALLAAVEVEPPTPARERVLEAGAALIGHRGLTGFSMEELAIVAGVSRATVYRLFPTKGALFGEIVRHYSPFEPVVALVQASVGRPPEEVIPRLARTVMVVGAPRVGIMRGVLLEATAATPEAISGVQRFVPEAIAVLSEYLVGQMDAGHIRRMHPVLAVQLILGPLVFHLLPRPIAAQVIGFAPPIEQVADELAAAILEGLAA
jgi:AcrR family transcriptional regulator